MDITLADLKAAWDRPLLSKADTNTKTNKSLKLAKMGSILYMASHDQVSPFLGYKVSVCAYAKKNKCYEPCLDFAGRGKFDRKIRICRLRKAYHWFTAEEDFRERLRNELAAQARLTVRRGIDMLDSFVRLDGTSDLGLSEEYRHEFPELMFYDYTKDPIRYYVYLGERDDGRADNWHLTFSLGAGNKSDAIKILKAGGNVAVVFDLRKNDPLPDEWEGFPVIDGDEHDVRYKDPMNTVCGLRVKSITKVRKAAGQQFLTAGVS